mgnify:CR=1 FL=1
MGCAQTPAVVRSFLSQPAAPRCIVSEVAEDEERQTAPLATNKGRVRDHISEGSEGKNDHEFFRSNELS